MLKNLKSLLIFFTHILDLIPQVFRTIFERFDEIGRKVIRVDSQEIRQLGSNVSDDHLKMLRYLGIDINVFKGIYS